MKILAKIAFGSLASVLLISGIAVVTPRAVLAVVATIIRDQDNPARHPFTTFCASPQTTFVANGCDVPAIPAGQEVVIETISFDGAADPRNAVMDPLVDITPAAAGIIQHYSLNPIFDSGRAQPTQAVYQGLQSLRLYAGPGEIISCSGFTQNPNSSGIQFSVGCRMAGYFVTLP
jgi:hypothetical protein